MKKIKINFVGFWKGFDKNANFLTDILKEKYEIEVSDNPDFCFFFPLEAPFEWCEYDCVRIMLTGEPYSCNFNAYDYVIAFDYINFQDRYFRFPFAFYSCLGTPLREKINEQQARNKLKEKEYFCNLICSHPDGIREEIFKKLSSYKRVEAPGTYLNNMGGFKVKYGDDKINFLKKSKFTICSEGLNYPGFTTEKIMDALKGYSIPIYVGDPFITKDFNEKSFINANGKSLDEILDIVKKYDSDDELYISTLMENPFNKDGYELEIYQKFKDFLYNIFDQEPDKAFRRIREYQAKWQEGFEKQYRKFYGSFFYKVLRKLNIIK